MGGRGAGRRLATAEAGCALLLEGGEALAVVVGAAQVALHGVLGLDGCPQADPLVAQPRDELLLARNAAVAPAAAAATLPRVNSSSSSSGTARLNSPAATASAPVIRSAV